MADEYRANKYAYELDSVTLYHSVFKILERLRELSICHQLLQ